MALRLDMHLGADYPVLEAYMHCRDDRSCIRGPLGSGKTIASAQRLLLQCAEQAPNDRGERKTRCLVARNTYLDLTQTTIKDFLAVWEGLGTMRYGGLEPPNFEARFTLEDSSTVDADIIFLALDRDDAIRKLKGYQVTIFWFNELSEIHKSIIDMADLRVGRFGELQGGIKPSWFGMFGDTNSYDVDHWLYRLQFETDNSGWTFFSQPGGVLDTGTYDANGVRAWRPNPLAENLKHLPDGYYIRGMQGKSEDWIRVMLANEFGFVKRGKPVHPQYIDGTHCSPTDLLPLERYPLLLGFDFGRTPCCEVGQYWEHIGRHVGLDELTSDDMSASIFAPEVKRMLDRKYQGMQVRGWGDPAGDAKGQATEDTPILIVRAAGIPIGPAPSNIPALRRASLANPMMRMCMDARPAYLISPRQKKLRKGLGGGFHYRKLQVSGPDERYSDEPEKNEYSHPVEAEEYMRLGAGEGQAALRRPQEMRPGRMQETAVSEWNP